MQEIDIKTGLVMWEWHALGHISARRIAQPVARDSYPWDYVHINSVDPGPADDVLLSARNTWTLYDVDLHSGAIHWRLGGSALELQARRAARASTGSTTPSSSPAG